MPLEKAGNDQCPVYFDKLLTNFVFIFLPNSTVKLCETWHGQSHVYPEEEFIPILLLTLKEF